MADLRAQYAANRETGFARFAAQRKPSLSGKTISDRKLPFTTALEQPNLSKTSKPRRRSFRCTAHTRWLNWSSLIASSLLPKGNAKFHARYFWRRRLRKQVRHITRNLPQLPEDVDDNVFIALANQAAETDKSSAGFDEFMFSEDGYETMPYEDSVDQFLSLQIERVGERSGRAALFQTLRVEHLKTRVAHQRRVVEDAELQLEKVSKLIAEERKVLSGDQLGNDGARWTGVALETTSRAQHLGRRILGWAVFVLVGLIDAFVVFYSLRLLTPTEDEARFFSAPAVGVQILFPHLVGKALGVLQRKEGNRAKELSVVIGVGLAWVAYLYGMSQIRMNLLTTLYFEKTRPTCRRHYTLRHSSSACSSW